MLRGLMLFTVANKARMELETRILEWYESICREDKKKKALSLNINSFKSSLNSSDLWNFPILLEGKNSLNY